MCAKPSKPSKPSKPTKPTTTNTGSASPKSTSTSGSGSSAAAVAGAGFDLKKLVPIPKNINKGLSSAKRSTMKSILGLPRPLAAVDSKCRDVTEKPLLQLLVTQDVGPFRVTGVRQAVASLRRVMKEIKDKEPEIYESLGTAGMTCVRHIAGTTSLSNHSWGTAIDIKIGDVLDGLGKTGHDGMTLEALVKIAPMFHSEGWYWGVGFSSFEDGMHFEVADETIRKWHKDGEFIKAVSKRRAARTSVSLGDVGADVRIIQEALADRGFDILVDGVFGERTRDTVIEFQATNDLEPDGIVGSNTRKVLGIK